VRSYAIMLPTGGEASTANTPTFSGVPARAWASVADRRNARNASRENMIATLRKLGAHQGESRMVIRLMLRG